MQNDIDPRLLGLFAEKNAPLPSEHFMQLFLAKLERTRRARALRRVALVASAVFAGAWFAPTVLQHTASVADAATQYALPYGPLVVSPIGWAVSTLIGLVVLMRAGALRRR
jgi:hypothetical protein